MIWKQAFKKTIVKMTCKTDWWNSSRYSGFVKQSVTFQFALTILVGCDLQKVSHLFLEYKFRVSERYIVNFSENLDKIIVLLKNH